MGKSGGGVLIAVKECLHVTRRTDHEIDAVEVLVVQLSKANNKRVIVYVFYHPPDSSSYDLELLNSSLLSNPESSCCILLPTNTTFLRIITLLSSVFVRSLPEQNLGGMLFMTTTKLTSLHFVEPCQSHL